MTNAARVGDPTGHPGTEAGPGVVSVLICGQPAAVAGDTHQCDMPPPSGPHPATPFPPGSATVFVGGQPALRVGDAAGCGAPILSGAPTVLVG